MTTLNSTIATCPICGAQSDQLTLGSSSSFGSPDLDTRPPELLRSSLPFWIATCPSCGLIAGPGLDLDDRELTDEQVNAVRALITRQAYTDPPGDTPGLAAKFLRRALVSDVLSDMPGAAWATLHAAWACDDASAEAPALACRESAADRFASCRANAIPFAANPATEYAITADVLRRADRFAAAVRACDDGFASKPDPDVRAFLLLVRTLSQQGDATHHTCEEASV